MGFSPGPGGSGSIAGSTDVTLNAVQNDQVLSYDSPSSKWHNKTNSATSTYENLPAGTTISVYYAGSTWPARPTARTDITIQWLDFDGSAPTPSGLIESVDIIYHDIDGLSADAIAARWTGNGVADGTAITWSNDDAAGNSTGTGITWSYAVSGTPTSTYAGNGFRVVSTATSDISRIDGAITSPGKAGRFQLILTPQTTPSISGSILDVRNSSARMAALSLATNLTVYAEDGAGMIPASASPAIALSDKLLLDLVVTQASSPSTSNGRIFFRVKNLTNTSWNTTGEHFWDSGYTRNLGTTDLTTSRFGKLVPSDITGSGLLFEQLGAEAITVSPSDTSEAQAKGYFADAP